MLGFPFISLVPFLCTFHFKACLVKVKFSLCFFFLWAPRHEGVLGSGDIAPHILDLSTRWRLEVSFTPLPFYPQGESPWYPLDSRLGGPQSRYGRGGEEKNFQALSRLEPPIIQPVAQCYSTELSQLLSCLVQWPILRLVFFTLFKFEFCFSWLFLQSRDS
jgi:hypothetical protein